MGVKKGFPVIGKSLSAVGYSVLLRGRGGLRPFPCPILPRFDTLILPLISATLFLFRFLGKLCQFIFKLADMVEVYPHVLSGVSRSLFVALMNFNPAVKLAQNGGGGVRSVKSA